MQRTPTSRRRQAPTRWTAPALALMTGLVLACSSGDAGDSDDQAHAAQRQAVLQPLRCSAAPGRGWCWQQPLPALDSVLALQFSASPGDPGAPGWAVGEGGLLLRTQDGGQHWRVLPPFTPQALTALAFHDPQTGWVADAQATLWFTADGGATWQPHPLPGAEGHRPTRLWSWPGRGLAVLTQRWTGEGWAHRLWLREPGAAEWRHEPVHPRLLVVAPGPLVYTVQDNAQDGRAIGQLVRISGTQAAQRLFSPRPDRDIKALGRDEATGELWLMTGAPSVPRESPPAGSVWWPVRANHQAELLRSADEGLHWHSQAVRLPAGSSMVLDSVKLDSAGRGLAQGAWRELLHTEDGGRSWSVAPAPVGQPLLDDPQVLDSRQALARTEGPEATWIHDGGRRWQTLALPHGERLGQFDAPEIDATGALVFRHVKGTGHPQRVWRHVPGPMGGPWQAVGGVGDSSVAMRPEDTLGLHFFNSRRGLLLSSTRGLLATNDGGLAWHTSVPAPAADTPQHLAATAQGEAWLWQDDTLRYSPDQGRQWQGRPLPSLTGDAPQLVAAGEGCLWATRGPASQRSTDTGRSWQNLPLPAAGSQVLALGFADCHTGVLLSQDGSVWRTRDGGTHWQRTSLSLPDSHGARLHWVDASTVWLMRWPGQLLLSRDGGLSWSRRSWPTGAMLADLAFTNAQQGWLVGAHGAVYRTDDGAHTWHQQVSGSGLHLQKVVAHNPRSAWIGGSHGALLGTATGGAP